MIQTEFIMISVEHQNIPAVLQLLSSSGPEQTSHSENICHLKQKLSVPFKKK